MERIRNAFAQLRDALAWAPDIAVAGVILGVATTLALWLHSVLMHVARRLLGRRPYARSILKGTQGPTRLGMIVLALILSVPAAPLAPETASFIAKLLLATVVGLIGWAGVSAVNTAAEIYLLRFRLDVEDNLLARKHVTQIRILLRSVDSLLLVVTVAAALMTFDSVRQYGVSLFASAGVAGLVVGLAARPALSNLLAGIQLAVAQPIRIDDAVVVENEWGRVEEINSTYVVVRLWDLRRLIVPLSYFIEKPFQNWTHADAEVIASVLLYVDYATPVDRIRSKAKEIGEQSPLWNSKLLKVEISDAKENTMEVRILASARTAAAAWDLRCEMREKLIQFMLEDYPAALPQKPPPAHLERKKESATPARRAS